MPVLSRRMARLARGHAMSDDLNKAQRLALAGAVAPALRGATEKTRARRIALVGADGQVTGYTTLGEVQDALLAARGIELAVGLGALPDQALCKRCGKAIPVAGSKIPLTCRGGCQPDMKCVDCPNLVTRKSAERASRQGRDLRCRSCTARVRVARLQAEGRWRTPETEAKRLANTRATITAMTPEKRVEKAKKAWATRRAKAAQAYTQSSTSQGNIDE